MNENNTGRGKDIVSQHQVWFRLLRMACPTFLYEEIEGDIIQRFESDEKLYGLFKARRRLRWNVLHFVRSEIVLRNHVSIGLNQGIMIRNYARVMLRNVIKRKLYAGINIAGLTVGITFALLIGVFVYGELQVNQNIKDADRLYLVESKLTGAQSASGFVPGALLPHIASLYPDMVDNYYRIWDRGITISKGDKHFRIQSMLGDSTFQDMFGFEVLYGNKLHALARPNSMIVTESIARKYFNRADIVGETLGISTEGGGKKDFEITAVIANPPVRNSVTDYMHMGAEVFFSFANKEDFSFGPRATELWDSDIISFLKLSPGTTAEKMTEAINQTFKKDAPPAVSKQRKIVLMPLKDYYRTTANGAVQTTLISLSVIVIFILLLAISNFINISIASSFSRLKEVGVRKVIGGVKRQVIVQFMTESILFALVSGAFAVILFEFTRGFFGEALGAVLPSVITFDIGFWACVIGVVVFIGILAGAYPSFYLSTTQPIDSLKGKLKSNGVAGHFSRGLIITQFLITIFIFTGALTMSQQISFFLDKNLGFDKSSVLVITSVPRLWSAEGYSKVYASKQEFLTSPVVSAVSLSTGTLAGNLSMFSADVYQADHGQEQSVNTAISGADEDFARVYGMKMLSGKFFTDAGETPVPNSVVINESARKALSVSLGDHLKIANSGNQEFQVVGIIDDFNFESLHAVVKPAMFFQAKEFLTFRMLSIKINPGHLSDAVDAIEVMWRKIFPDDAFVYQFADESIQKLYATELRLKKAASIATMLMLVIVLTGILGLVSLSVAKRNKEIGIRKVLGASAPRILLLLSKEYAIIMVVGFLIGAPFSYWFSKTWLDRFAYHIEPQWWMFCLPMAALAGLTLAVVAAQGIKTALANPVKSLRYE